MAPVKPTLKAPVTKRLTLLVHYEYDKRLSTFAFKIDLRRYMVGPVHGPVAGGAGRQRPAARRHRHAGVPGRGLHSFTFRLNVSALCGIGGAYRGCLRGVMGYLGVFRV